MSPPQEAWAEYLDQAKSKVAVPAKKTGDAAGFVAIKVPQASSQR